MLSKDFQAAAAPMIRTMRIIWGAFVAAALFYCVIAYFVTANRTELPVIEPILPMVLIVVAVVTLFGSFIVPRFLLTRERLQKALSYGSGIGLPDTSHLPEDERKLPGVLAHYQTTMIISMAMVEAASIYGLVLVILGKPWWYILPFAGATVLFAIPHFPRPESALEAARALARYDKEGRP
jgi:F0F1-type ATP synthase membrane subunit c/vacuolar-type H+-ATPase subunit K